MAMTAIEWNIASLKEYLWKRLGARKRTVGREVVDRATEALIQKWPFAYTGDEEPPTADDPAFARMKDEVIEELHKYEGGPKYGFIWAIVLSAVISQLVKLLIEWWLKRRENRIALQCMKIQRRVEDIHAGQ